MLRLDLFSYAILVLIWIVYILNAFYQNKKMNTFFIKFWGKEILSLPFYIFCFFTSFIITNRIKSAFFNASQNFLPGNLSKTIFLTGLFFCLISILLYTYLNFFEKSFPSCKAIKKKKELSGIYNYIRHPSYYLVFFITFGTALYLQNYFMFFLACLNHIFFYFYFVAEEDQIKNGNLYYKEYLKKTKRFFPTFNSI